MSSRKRRDSAEGRMYRAVIERFDGNGELVQTRYIGPYATAAPAKAAVTSASRSTRYTGHVEYADPTWSPL